VQDLEKQVEKLTAGLQKVSAARSEQTCAANGQQQSVRAAENLSKAGWSWGWVSAIGWNGRTTWIADAHRGDGKRFVYMRMKN
jgi:hypothetical protein